MCTIEYRIHYLINLHFNLIKLIEFYICFQVSSTENGIIFGNISYDVRGSSGETTCIVLNDIHIDIMEYIMPATCTPSEFRQMWSEFEWENKVSIKLITKCLNVE